MPRFLNERPGIVWSIKEDHMMILLPRGGKIRAPLVEGIREDQHVVFIMDAFDEHVIDVLDKKVADEIVKRGSNHIFDSALRPAPLEQEDDDYGEYGQREWDDCSILWCPELGEDGHNY